MSMTTPRLPAKRQRGTIDQLPSGALRVRVYAGLDPVTKKRHDLVEVIPPGPKVDAGAEAARIRLVNEINERRNSRTRASVAQLVDRHLVQAELEQNTLDSYRGYVKKHIKPLLGKQRWGRWTLTSSIPSMPSMQGVVTTAPVAGRA